MIIEPTERAARSVGPPPVGTKLEGPPLAPVAHIIDRVLRRVENQGASLEHVRQSARIVLRLRRDLGEGDMARRPDELAEFAVCHWSVIDPERVDCHAMNRRLFCIMLVRPHPEGAAGNPDHIGVAHARTINVRISWNICRDIGHRRIPTRPNAPIISSMIATVTVIGRMAL
jgi:hypothetical protein